MGLLSRCSDKTFEAQGHPTLLRLNQEFPDLILPKHLALPEARAHLVKCAIFSHRRRSAADAKMALEETLSFLPFLLH